MLQIFRKNTKIIVWFAVFLMVGVFGLSSISLNKHEQYAGEVFGKQISFQEFRTFETLTRLLPPSQKITEDPQLEYQFTWQQLILSREAKNKGFQVSDNEVRQKVDQLVNPDESRRMTREEYLQILKSKRTTPNEFESGVRELIRIQKMVNDHFKPSAPAADKGPKEPEKRAAEEMKKNQEEYMRWMADILQRSKTIDYSKEAQKNLPPEGAQ